MDRAAVYIGIPLGNLPCLLCVLRRHGPHAHNCRPLKNACRLTENVGLVHGHIAAHGNVAHVYALPQQCLLKGEAAADQKSHKIILPVGGSIRHLIHLDAVFIDKIPWNICHQISPLTHIVDFRAFLHNLQNRAGLWILSRKFLKIICVLLRENYKICLGISPAHTGCGTCNFSSPDKLPHLFR